jgi:glycosyltransferase involved in cell wall biosynthesis
VRIASWPHWYEPNQYLNLLYKALAPFGVQHCPGVPLDYKKLVDAGIDMCHLHWPEPFWREPAGALPTQLWRVAKLRRQLSAMRKRGIATVWTVHNLDHHEGTQLCDRLGYQLLHRFVDLRVFHSRWARDVCIDRYGFVRGDTILMPHGNYDGAFPPPHPGCETLRRAGIPAGRQMLLCFGQVRRYKGFDVAVEALDHLPKNTFHLVIAGRPVGDYADVIRDAADGRENVSLMLRDISDQEAADLVSASEAVLFPYRETSGSGALLAALTLSKGVVATDLPYFREVLALAPQAYALTNPDPVDLARTIREFCASPVQVREKAARALASEYAWPRVIGPLAKWITTRLGSRNSSGR